MPWYPVLYFSQKYESVTYVWDTNGRIARFLLNPLHKRFSKAMRPKERRAQVGTLTRNDEAKIRMIYRR